MGFASLLQRLTKRQTFVKNHILGISKHIFGNCILTLTSLVLSEILPHTIVPILGHFQPILLQELLSLFLQACISLLHSENSFPQPVSSLATTAPLSFPSPTSLLERISILVDFFLNIYSLFTPLQTWFYFYHFTENCSH